MLKRFDKYLVLVILVGLLGFAYLWAYQPSEPFFNNDETRHVMTGVYFRDLLRDMPFGHLRDYTVNYYLQYPALGLLVWPPFFYFVEGLAMSIFGTSIVVPKALVALFALMACVYLYRLVRLSHDTTRAAVALLFFGLSPLFFGLSHYVMLEVPTLALSLAATYHFVSYLDTERRRDLLLAALFSALAALTRFDAIYLLPLFLLLLALRGRWKILRRRDVWLMAVLALLLIAPFYALSATDIGWMHFKFVTETVSPSVPGFLSLRRLLFYPSRLPAQLGWLALIPALVGIGYGLTAGLRREQVRTFLAMIAAAYVTFTPMGELESRHAIYWIPAFAFFAADGVALIAAWLRAPQLYLPLAACVLAGVMWLTLAKPLTSLRGYEETAQTIAASAADSPFCLFVGRLNGNFVYQLRRQDTQRRLWVLRADKLLFNLLIVPDIQYKQVAASDEETLATIFKYDPEFIVMEEPAPESFEGESQEERLRTEFEKQVRAIINAHPERFSLEKSVAVASDEPQFRGMTLKIFRNTYRNHNPERRLEVDVLMLRRSLQTIVP